MKPEIYTIATAHLDTSWLWKLEQSITEYIPETLKRNFEFFEKFPEYKFNFEGSIRYEFIKEYYPEEYAKLKKYVDEGRWHPAGACYENGDVNIPSPEALIRNILYGKDYFRKEFGVESEDIFLPDCFGFGRALPTVANHSGVKGFSTGKLFWGSSVEIPFDTGIWKGIDGKGVWAALMPFSYTTAFGDLRKAKRINEKIEENIKKKLPTFTFVYHGVGDRGGAPHKTSVKNVIKAARDKSRDKKVVSATTKEYFDMLETLPEETKSIMPDYNGEFLLTAHGAGSYTARNVTKRWNRRSELLADAAERFASAAFINGLAEYPQYRLDDAWKRVIAHHFHDDITGTSFEECYLRSHSDYVQAMNTFSDEYTAACKKLSGIIDTSFCQGIPVVVSNPVEGSTDRKEAVRVKINSKADFFTVYDNSGSTVPSQVTHISDTEKEIIFIAEVPSVGLRAYDIRESDINEIVKTGITVSQTLLENDKIAVSIDENGDISGIFDKSLNKELLSSPVRMQILNNTHSFDWPAWEIKYEDCSDKPYMYPEKPLIKIKDNGPALCSLEITRKAGKSVFRQIISLDSVSPYVSVYNETDWREEASLLKAHFSFTAQNENASYDIGCGSTKRPTNTEKLYEVPAQKWADITDDKEGFGVSVFSDSRAGWDKPDKSSLRLTVVHTPMVNYRWECSQHIMDMGLNRYSFAIMGHNGGCDSIQTFAERFCQPMHTFVTDRHTGKRTEFSFVKTNNENVRITAIKKAQNSDDIVLRVTETSGKDLKDVAISLSATPLKAYEIRGDETHPEELSISDGKLKFDIGHNSIKSFLLSFGRKEISVNTKEIPLSFNATGITTDKNRSDSSLRGGISIPREITPDTLLTTGIRYSFSQEDKNCLVCDGRKITVDSGYDTLHLLVTSLNKDKYAEFGCKDGIKKVLIPDCFESPGHWDMMQQKLTGYIKEIPQAITLSHSHEKDKNAAAKQFYLFSIALPVGDNREVTLPKDDELVIFAATAEKTDIRFIKGDEHFDTLRKREFDYTFSEYAVKHMYPNKLEKLLEKIIDPSYTMYIKIGEFHNKYAFNELYYILRSLNDRLHYKKEVEKLITKRKTDM